MRREIMLTHAVQRRIEQQIAEESPDESMGILGCGLSSSQHHSRIVVKTVFIPDSKDYKEQSPTSVLLEKNWFRNVLDYCARHQLHVLLYHSHPFSDGEPHESSTDFAAARSMYPDICEALPGMAVGSILFNASANNIEAHFFNRQTDSRDPVDLVFIPDTSSLRVMFPQSSPCRKDLNNSGDDLFWSRFRLAFGEEMVQVAGNLHVVVIGAGSLGEPVAVQLANLGFPLTIVDTDAFGSENANRSWYGHPEHEGTLKTEIVKQAVLQSNPDASITTLAGDIRDKEVQEQLTHANIFVVTTDNLASRFTVSNLAMNHGMVVFDVGTEIDVEDGSLSSVRGQVMRLAPGLNLCHDCAGFFDSEKANDGLLSDDDYEAERQGGYINDPDMPAPSVMPVNSVLAGSCVWQILRYLSGSDGTPTPDLVGYDILNGHIENVTYERNADGMRVSCPTCSPEGTLFSGDRGPYRCRKSVSTRDRIASAKQKIEEHDYGTADTAESVERAKDCSSASAG